MGFSGGSSGLTSQQSALLNSLPIVMSENSLETLEIQALQSLPAGTSVRIIKDVFSDSNGYKNTVDTANCSANFNTNKYEILDYTSLVGAEYVIVEATSLSSVISNVNNCYSKKISSSKWLIYCTSGTDEERRSKLHKTLWYGTDGSNAQILNFTGVTAVNVSHSSDVGKRGIYVYQTASAPAVDYNNMELYYTGTFENTLDNTNVNSWSYVTASGSSSYGKAYWEMASGNILNGGSSSYNVDEFGTDTSADNKTNPATVRLRNSVQTNHNYSSSANVKSVILTKGGVAFVATDNGGSQNSLTRVYGNIDYHTDHAIPEFTQAESLSSYSWSMITNEQNLDITPEFFQIFAWGASTTGTGSITGEASFDNGVNYQDSLELDTPYAIENTGNEAIFQLNFNPGASSGTAECKGYGVIIW